VGSPQVTGRFSYFKSLTGRMPRAGPASATKLSKSIQSSRRGRWAAWRKGTTRGSPSCACGEPRTSGGARSGGRRSDGRLAGIERSAGGGPPPPGAGAAAGEPAWCRNPGPPTAAFASVTRAALWVWVAPAGMMLGGSGKLTRPGAPAASATARPADAGNALLGGSRRGGASFTLAPEGSGLGARRRPGPPGRQRIPRHRAGAPAAGPCWHGRTTRTIPCSSGGTGATVRRR
jgi:hypothetical protein